MSEPGLGVRHSISTEAPDPTGPRQFATTHWSLVGAAKPDEVSQTRARENLTLIGSIHGGRREAVSERSGQINTAGNLRGELLG